MDFLKRSPTGKYEYWQSDGRLKLIRYDYSPNQPRDSNGRFASGGGGGGGKRGGGRKSGGGGGGGVPLLNQKVKDLQETAAAEGIDVSKLSHVSRKSVLAAAIEAKRAGKDLREEGLLKPTKAGVGNRGTTPVAPRSEQQDKKYYKAKSLEYQELKKSGESYAKNFADQKYIKPSAKEQSLMDQRVQLGKQFVAAGKDSTPEGRAIKAKFQEVDKEYWATRNERRDKQLPGLQAMRDDIKRQSAISTEQAQALAKKVSIESNIQKKQVKAIRETMADYFELTGGRGADSLKKLTYVGDRPYANRAGAINIGKHDGSEGFNKTGLFHEMSHHVEYENPELYRAAADFRSSKATSQTMEKLSTITGNSVYADNEVALKDTYLDPYVGKVSYTDRAKRKAGDKYDPSLPESSTEVISMGLERFQNPELMRTLREKDPEHFHFMVGLLVNHQSK